MTEKGKPWRIVVCSCYVYQVFAKQNKRNNALPYYSYSEHLLSKIHVLEEQIDGLTLYVHFEIGVCMELEDAVLCLHQPLTVHPYMCTYIEIYRYYACVCACVERERERERKKEV
jgi:hypothetical protein